KDNLNTFDFGAGLGIGYRITPQIGINARYVAGFTNIGKDNTVLSDSKNNNFQVGLSFGF
ncbi:MAG: PorT family protein, partial [Chryseobacterium sp.]